jgi:glycosyltransferase involved in cell wall biosynthesis
VSRRLRIGIVCGSLPHEVRGGLELQVVRTASELARDHDVTVFARLASGGSVPSLGSARLVPRRTLALPWLRTPVDVVRGLGQLRGRRDLDVLLCFQTLIAGWIGAEARRWLGVPFVLWLRSQMEYRLGPTRFGITAPYVLAAADRVFVQAEPIRRELLATFDRPGLRRLRRRLGSRIAVVPNGVDPGPPRNGREGDYVVYVGRLAEGKGLPELIDAMRGFPGERLVVIGDGPLRSRLVRLATGLDVRFEGEVPQEQVLAALRGAKCLVLASESEGLPNGVLEAMAQGVPVLATAVGGVPSLIEDGRTGLLIPPRAPDELKRALGRLLSDAELRKALGRNARGATEGYAWPFLARRVATELEDVATQKPRTSA